jgi:acyl-homoserine lactone acylase PvdQ
VLGDIRYSMLPHRADPLWGIVFDPARPGVHADYRFFRDYAPGTRQAFLDMLF